MARLPNFLIIGAQKSGTTSLYNYLKQHPQVWMSPVKEPHFFAYEGQAAPMPSMVTTLSDYQALFTRVGDAVAVGEASTSYLHTEQAARRIRYYLPNVRLIAILRHPAERAFSNWLHNRRSGVESLSFTGALRAEKQRLREEAYVDRTYQHKGYYHRHLARYLGLFPRDHISICLFDDLTRDPDGLMRTLFEFLGVETGVRLRLEQHNVSGLPRKGLGQLYDLARRSRSVRPIAKRLVPESLRKWMRELLLTRPSLAPDVRRDLIEAYRDDILRLQDLLQRDLSSWLE
jgi:hypothetical protein